MRLGRILIGAAVLAPSIAVAEAPQRIVAPSGQASLYDVVVGPANEDGYQSGRQVLPPSGDDTAGALAASRTVFLNKNGVTLSPGINDSRINRSTVVAQPTTIPAWNVSASVWADTVSCIREVFSPFDITIVDADPGNVPHIEAVFGGTPTTLGLSAQLSGVSPFTTDCAVIENSIVFTFMGSLPADARLACQVQAQEIAHSFGLDHVLLTPEIMTYLPYAGRRWFQNQAASCGEDKARPCGLNGSVCRQSQNSVALLIERVGLRGLAGDTVAPTVGITSPRDGETVPPMFDVDFTANDNAKVLMASLYLDGTPSGTVVAAPLSITMPRALSAGTHKLRIVATDGNNEKAQEITVTVSGDAEEDVVGGCAAGGGGGGGAAGAALSLALVALARRRRRG
jgi:hypothetical protein